MRSAVQSCDPLQENDTADSSAVFFVACKDEVRPYKAGDHESWLSMGYRQIRQMPPGMAGDKSDSTRDSNHGVFLGNKRLRSKSGLEGDTEWRLKYPATRYKKATLQRNLRCFFCMPGRQSVKDGIRINGKSMLIQEPSQELARGSEKVMTSGRWACSG